MFGITGPKKKARPKTRQAVLKKPSPKKTLSRTAPERIGKLIPTILWDFLYRYQKQFLPITEANAQDRPRFITMLGSKFPHNRHIDLQLGWCLQRLLKMVITFI